MISKLIGLNIKQIEVNETNDKLIFYMEDGDIFEMYHDQECCEDVYLQDIVGELDDLIDNPILIAEKREVDQSALSKYDGYYLWTFYEFATIKGSVTLRWYGTSNGYYSVDVSFEKRDWDKLK